MNELSNAFIQTFEPDVLAMGFKRKGGIFYRLYNEKIIDLLALCKYSGGSFTIQFELMPMCDSELEFASPMDADRIGVFLGRESMCEWEYWNKDNLNISMREALEVCRVHLFPVFERVKDYQTYYEFAWEWHRLSYANDTKSIYVRFPRAGGFYEVCLAIEKYDVAKSIHATYEEMLRTVYRNSYWHHDWCQEIIESQKPIEKAIDIGDRQYIMKYIKTLEERNKEIYYGKFRR